MKIIANFSYSNTELFSYIFFLYKHMRKLHWFIIWLVVYLILLGFRLVHVVNGSGPLLFLGDGFFMWHR